jgi:hypothetical protein
MPSPAGSSRGRGTAWAASDAAADLSESDPEAGGRRELEGRREKGALVRVGEGTNLTALTGSVRVRASGPARAGPPNRLRAVSAELHLVRPGSAGPQGRVSRRAAIVAACGQRPTRDQGLVRIAINRRMASARVCV